VIDREGRATTSESEKRVAEKGSSSSHMSTDGPVPTGNWFHDSLTATAGAFLAILH
jgi:hypothetical protein